MHTMQMCFCVMAAAPENKGETYRRAVIGLQVMGYWIKVFTVQ